MYRMYGMSQGAMEGGAAMYRMYGMSQGAMEGGAAIPMGFDQYKRNRRLQSAISAAVLCKVNRDL